MTVKMVNAFTLFTMNRVLLIKTCNKVIGTLPSDSYAIFKVYNHRFLVHRTRYGKNWDYSIEVAAQRHFQSNLHFSFAPHPERGDSVDWQD
jgi:hypothetical protein